MALSENPIRVRMLSPADGQALDRALDALAGRAGGATGPAAEAGDERVAQMLKLLNEWPVEDPPADLTQRTLTRITDHEQRQRLAMNIQALSAPAVAFRWRELMTVAAVVLIGLSLLWPMLAQTRDEARRIACQARLGSAGMAIGDYANDNQGQMPHQPQTAWTSVGLPAEPDRPQTSNSANLYLLVRQGYIDPSTLACPANPYTPKGMTPEMTDWPTPQAVPYSYQNQMVKVPPRLDSIPTVVILADRNPLFAPDPNNPHVVVFQRNVQFTAPSYLHNRRGQNTLMANGAVLWRRDPVMPNNDNIWLANGITNYQGNESPAGPEDSFLVP